VPGQRAQGPTAAGADPAATKRSGTAEAPGAEIFAGRRGS